MKNQFIIPSIIIAAAILGGFWMLKPPAELPETPDISIHDAADSGNIELVKQHLAAGTDVNAVDHGGLTPLDWAIMVFSSTKHVVISSTGTKSIEPSAEFKLQQKQMDDSRKKVADLLRKHGAKTGEELKNTVN